MRPIFLGCGSGGAGLDGTGLELEGFGFRPALTVLAMTGKSASKKVGASEGCQGVPRPGLERRGKEKKRGKEKRGEKKRGKEKKTRKEKKKRRREEIIYLQE